MFGIHTEDKILGTPLSINANKWLTLARLNVQEHLHLY